MSMSKTFIGSAVCREFESEAPMLTFNGHWLNAIVCTVTLQHMTNEII